MKTEISHLPTEKQELLLAITEILRTGPVEMLILFGSHARGDWVNDPETGYVSDWDLLVVVESEAQVADVTQWGELERRVRERLGQTPLTLIVHDIKFVNREIRIGQYFFVRPVPPKGCLHPGWGPKTRKGGRRKVLENLCAVQV